MPEAPRSIFICCVPEDWEHAERLRRHMAPLVRRRTISIAPFQIHTGVDPWEQIALQIEAADVIIILLSADHLAREEFDLIEQRALKRHRLGAAEVLPVIVRPCQWQQTSLVELSALPSNGRAVTSWSNPEEAWIDVVHGISRALHFPDQTSTRRFAAAAERSPDRGERSFDRGERSSDRGERSFNPADEATAPTSVAPESPSPTVVAAASAPPPAAPLRIDRIFQVTGQPEINFVEPSQIPEICDRLRNLGHGLVVEGPSGIGKTTAVRKALDMIAPAPPPTWLAAKKRGDVERLRALLADDFRAGGHLVVDDFHRLERALQQQIADLMKIIADDNRRDAKVTVIGINPVGRSLVHDFPDLANRFAVVPMKRQPDEKIDALITKGEQAANILFRQHREFVAAAAGSFFTAQLLCYEAALKEGVRERQASLRIVETGPSGYVTDKVLANLAFRYHERLIAFACHDERPPPRGACLTLLWLLARSEDNSVSLAEARYRYPQLAGALDWLMASNLAQRFVEMPRLGELFYYNRDAAVLSAEDPQLDFYLANLKWEAFARDTGHDTRRMAWDPELGPVFDGHAVVAPGDDQEESPGGLPRSWILHLSDLHLGTREQAAIWSEQLLSDLRNDLGLTGLDAVIVSGDITNRAAVEEYKAASQLLLDLRQEFRLPPQHIVLAPGNHDVSWDVSRRAYTPRRRAEWKEPLVDGEYIDGGPDYVEIRDPAEWRARFQQFRDFYYEVRLESYPLEYEQQATVHHLATQRLLVLGLNSAWAIDHHYRGRASIHGVALGQALRLVRTTAAFADCLKLAVFHHPVAGDGEDRIRDTGFLEQLAQAGFRVALHGHLHKAQPGLFRHDVVHGGRRIDLVGAGTFGAPVREWVPGYPLQYQVLEIAGRHVTVHTRRREEPGGAWKPDARWLQGAARDPLPRYEIEL